MKKGSITQPQALGLSAGLKSAGYALLCVGFAHSDLEVELQDPDEARRRVELRAARAGAWCAGGRAREVSPGVVLSCRCTTCSLVTRSGTRPPA